MHGAGKKMRVVSKRTLATFWTAHPQATGPLVAWHDAITSREWKNFAELRQMSRTVDYVGGDRFVFNIAGNKFRLIVRIDFRSQLAFVRFIGTHKEYDGIDDVSSA